MPKIINLLGGGEQPKVVKEWAVFYIEFLRNSPSIKLYNNENTVEYFHSRESAMARCKAKVKDLLGQGYTWVVIRGEIAAQLVIAAGASQ